MLALADALATLLPATLTVDTFEGRAYLGVVSFLMRDVSPWWSPSVPGVSTFPELNVRTYVHNRGRDPGVWFFSLDAAKLLVVLAARAGWRLPYSWAQMSIDESPDRMHYRSRRRWPGGRTARFEARYRVGEPIGTGRPGSFEHFLAERYLLYTTRRDGRPLRGQVHHRPYPLHRVELFELRETMLVAAGLPAPAEPPHLLFSPGVDVDTGRLTEPRSGARTRRGGRISCEHGRAPDEDLHQDRRRGHHRTRRLQPGFEDGCSARRVRGRRRVQRRHRRGTGRE